MKRKKRSYGRILAILIGLIFSFSACNKEMPENTGDELLDNSFDSKAFSDFTRSYGYEISNLQLEFTVKENYSNLNKTMYTIPVEKRGKQVGLLRMIVNSEGLYRYAYENLENFNTQTREGYIDIEIEGKFVARIECTPAIVQGQNGVIMTIAEVAPSSSVVKTRSEEGSPSWWSCVQDCYKETKERCMDSAFCSCACAMLETGQPYGCDCLWYALCMIQCA